MSVTGKTQRKGQRVEPALVGTVGLLPGCKPGVEGGRCNGPEVPVNGEPCVGTGWISGRVCMSGVCVSVCACPMGGGACHACVSDVHVSYVCVCVPCVCVCVSGVHESSVNMCQVCMCPVCVACVRVLCECVLGVHMFSVCQICMCALCECVLGMHVSYGVCVSGVCMSCVRVYRVCTGPVCVLRGGQTCGDALQFRGTAISHQEQRVFGASWLLATLCDLVSYRIVA